MKHHTIAVARPWLLRVAVCVFVGLTFIPLTAEATINSVTVNTSRDYENADGYTYAEITIHGSVARADGSVGQYSVPAVIIYPRHRRGKGVGVVDWLNSAFYHFFPIPTTELADLSVHAARDRELSLRRGIHVRVDSMEQGGHRDLRAHGPRGWPTTQPPALRLHRPECRCVGDPAGRGAAAQGSERLSGQRRTRAGGDGSELRVFAGRRRSARGPRRGTRSHEGLRRPPHPDDRARVLEARRRRARTLVSSETAARFRPAGTTRP